MAQVIFNFEGTNTTIECNINDSMENIITNYLQRIGNEGNNLYYLYNGNIINRELTFNELANNLDTNNRTMRILVYRIDEDKNEIISKDIICPECKENILLNIKNFKINLSGCKNKHNINNILLNKYDETQKIDISNIKCNICNQNNINNILNNKFYICCTCNKNLCFLCKSNHDNEHAIINYDNKNYICQKHIEPFTKYCKKCKQDICIVCEAEHNNHEIFDLSKIKKKKNDLVKETEKLKKIINEFNK